MNEVEVVYVLKDNFFTFLVLYTGRRGPVSPFGALQNEVLVPTAVSCAEEDPVIDLLR